jgi:hypothetical protein
MAYWVLSKGSGRCPLSSALTQLDALSPERELTHPVEKPRFLLMYITFVSSMCSLCDKWTVLMWCPKYCLLLRRHRHHQRNRIFCTCDSMMETGPKQFLVCVEERETIFIKLTTCNRSHATGPLYVRTTCDFKLQCVYDCQALPGVAYENAYLSLSLSEPRQSAKRIYSPLSHQLSSYVTLLWANKTNTWLKMFVSLLTRWERLMQNTWT